MLFVRISCNIPLNKLEITGECSLTSVLYVCVISYAYNTVVRNDSRFNDKSDRWISSNPIILIQFILIVMPEETGCSDFIEKFRSSNVL